MQPTESLPPLLVEPQKTPWWSKSFEETLKDFPYRKILHSLLAGNPFYLLSAVLMLYGIYRISIDPQAHHSERGEIAFNFSSLQLYEMLLVTVAIGLLRRFIWYDGTLLILLEHLFLFVPFILISQASMLDEPVSLSICLTGSVLVAVRMFLLKRHIPSLNMPGRLLAIGTVFLAIHLAIPLFYRSAIERNTLLWSQCTPWIWAVLLPAIFASINLLPRTRHWADQAPAKSWIPLLVITLWMGATASHVASVDFIDGVRFHWALTAPLATAALWTLYLRRDDLAANLHSRIDQALLVFPVLAPWLTLDSISSKEFMVLSLINAAGYAICSKNPKNSALALNLALLSLMMAVAAVPHSIGRIWMAEFTRTRAIAGSFGAYTLYLTLRSRSPQMTIVGAILCGLGTANIFTRLDYLEQFSLQNALLFALCHSARWEKKSDPLSALRCGLASFWVLHSYLWLRATDGDVMMDVALSGLLPILIAAAFRYIRGKSLPASLPLGGLGVELSIPLYFMIQALKIMPAGHLTVLGAFACFGAGTALAFTRPYWVRRLAPQKDSSEQECRMKPREA